MGFASGFSSASLRFSQHFPTKPQIGKNPWVFLVFLSFLWSFLTFRLKGKKPWNKNLTKSPWFLQKPPGFLSWVFVQAFVTLQQELMASAYQFPINRSISVAKPVPGGSVVGQLSGDEEWCVFWSWRLMLFNRSWMDLVQFIGMYLPVINHGSLI